jgi:hypothetical protein
LNNCVIDENNAGAKGGGIYSLNSELHLGNTTLAQNTTVTGGALCTDQSSIVSVNSILWNDNTTEIRSDGNNMMTFSYSDLRGGQEGIILDDEDTLNWLDGNIDADPIFINDGEHPFMLTYGSPCRNSGTPDTTGLYLPLNDLSGGPRVWEDRIDIGAYEWNNLGITKPKVNHSTFNVRSYPNPFSTSTTLEYELEYQATINLSIYNHLGQRVAVLVDKEQAAGRQQMMWEAEGMPAGVYYYRLTILRASPSGQADNCRLTTGKLVLK